MKRNEMSSKMSLKNIKIEGLSQIAYDCFLQQLMVVCKYYYGEYWKLFLDVRLKFEENSELGVNCKKLKLDKNYKEAMQQYYGISLVEVTGDMIFTECNEIYLVSVKAENYPLFINSGENYMEHSFLIYGETEYHYIVNDNYYNVTEFYIDKKLIEQYAVKKYTVKGNSVAKREADVSKNIKDVFMEVFFEKWNDEYERYEKVSNCDVACILQTIKKISEYLDTNAKIAQECYQQQPYIKKCGEILQECVAKINVLYYSFLKEYVKYGAIREEFFEKKIRILNACLLVEQCVKKEIENVLLNRTTYMDAFKEQAEEFLEYKIVYTRKLYEDGIDQYTLLALLSYFEKKNSIDDIDFVFFNVDNTYLEVLLKICKYKILAELQ